MRARDIMVSDLVTVTPEQPVGEALARMRTHELPMLPVVDAERRLLGVLSGHSLVEHVSPEYIASGDLKSIAYAPDLGLLRRNYTRVLAEPVDAVMDREPLRAGPGESLLSIVARIVEARMSEYLLVVDEEDRLLGRISCVDILKALARLDDAEVTGE